MLYVSFTGGRGRASKPAAGGAAHALGGSEDGRASLHGDGLVRLWLDGSAADGEHPRSGSKLETLLLRRIQRAGANPRQTFPPAAEGGQENRPQVGEKIARIEEVCPQGRQEGSPTGGQEERPEIHQEVGPSAGQEERQKDGETGAVVSPQASQEGAGRPAALASDQL
jgi:hypothetical protein